MLKFVLWPDIWSDPDSVASVPGEFASSPPTGYTVSMCIYFGSTGKWWSLNPMCH